MKSNSVRFGYKLWVAITPDGYDVQFYLYMGQEEFFHLDLGLAGFVVDKLTDCQNM